MGDQPFPESVINMGQNTQPGYIGCNLGLDTLVAEVEFVKVVSSRFVAAQHQWDPYAKQFEWDVAGILRNAILF